MSHYLQRIKWFGQISVCSQIQSQDFFTVLVFGGKEEDGDGAKGTNFPGIAIHFRHHDIQQRKVYLLPAENLKCLDSVGGSLYLVAAAF